MRTWLLTWNVERWPWDDSLNGYMELKNDICQVGHAYGKWTCGVNKSIQKGDRIFLIKLGSMPKGIVASGFAATTVFEGTHWDSEKKKEGKKARRIVIKYDRILDYKTDKILDFDKLVTISDKYHWSTQSSGIEIPENIAHKIEEQWNKI